VFTGGSEGCTELYSLEDFAFVNFVNTVVFGCEVLSERKSGKVMVKAHHIGSSF